MKTKWIAMAMTAAALVGFSTNVQAVLISSGTGTLASSATPGNTLSVAFTVDQTGLVYTYDYKITNPAGNKDGFGNPETVDSFNVTFNTVPLGALIAGNYNAFSGGGVTWTTTLGVLQPGTTSIDLFFTSLLAPTLGNANASDSVPPSPWSTLSSGGKQVAVPHVPDGGTTVMLFGAALTGLGLLRKKLIA